ncbi:hypothetical protein F5Y09DRAFT_316048 [Xylaria sp. FL1042]|nr:hypothetical protein F5Y09DRAFT_316048 [Xylaria sp. FL1042]
MNSEQINTSFVHPQLARNTHSVRLLSPHSNKEGLSFRLETFNINHCPEYATLSYCWGAQSPPSTITVNGQSFTNDEEERADQVQLMRELYTTSSFTIAWLGSDDGSSSLALELLTRRKGQYGKRKQGDRKREVRMEYYETKDLLLKLDGNPYWKRMWIMQEFILPPKLLIVCGPTGVWWDDMKRSHGMSNKTCVHMAGLFERRNMMHSQTSKFQFVRLLRIAKYRACTRPFDRVFALLGLAMPGDLQGLQVDYTMPTQALYRHVVGLLERVVKSEKEWMRMTKDLAEALELQPSERALTPPAWKWPLNMNQDNSDAEKIASTACDGVVLED